MHLACSLVNVLNKAFVVRLIGGPVRKLITTCIMFFSFLWAKLAKL